MSGNPDKLDGWGAIELHLGISRRAILRRGYPVRYYRATGRVYAFVAELSEHDKAGCCVGATNVHKRPQTSISGTA